MLLIEILVVVGISSVASLKNDGVNWAGTRGPYNASLPTIHFGGAITLNKDAKFFKYGRWATNSWHFLADWVNEEKGGINLNGVKHALKISYANDDSTSATAIEVVK
jgi:hypothetical protein